MLTVREAIIVEGRYDRIKLGGLVNAVIIETGGFRVFSDREKQALIRRIAAKNGILVLTDSDGAGFVIRNFLRGVVPPEQIKHCYVPQVRGPAGIWKAPVYHSTHSCCMTQGRSAPASGVQLYSNSNMGIDSGQSESFFG